MTDAQSRIADGVQPRKLGLRTFKDVIGEKVIRVDEKGFQVYDDYFSDSDTTVDDSWYANAKTPHVRQNVKPYKPLHQMSPFSSTDKSTNSARSTRGVRSTYNTPASTRRSVPVSPLVRATIAPPDRSLNDEGRVYSLRHKSTGDDYDADSSEINYSHDHIEVDDEVREGYREGRTASNDYRSDTTSPGRRRLESKEQNSSTRHSPRRKVLTSKHLQQNARSIRESPREQNTRSIRESPRERKSRSIRESPKQPNVVYNERTSIHTNYDHISPRTNIRHTARNNVEIVDYSLNDNDHQSPRKSVHQSRRNNVNLSLNDHRSPSKSVRQSPGNNMNHTSRSNLGHSPRELIYRSPQNNHKSPGKNVDKMSLNDHRSPGKSIRQSPRYNINHSPRSNLDHPPTNNDHRSPRHFDHSPKKVHRSPRKSEHKSYRNNQSPNSRRSPRNRHEPVSPRAARALRREESIQESSRSVRPYHRHSVHPSPKHIAVHSQYHVDEGVYGEDDISTEVPDDDVDDFRHSRVGNVQRTSNYRESRREEANVDGSEKSEEICIPNHQPIDINMEHSRISNHSRTSVSKEARLRKSRSTNESNKDSLSNHSRSSASKEARLRKSRSKYESDKDSLSNHSRSSVSKEARLKKSRSANESNRDDKRMRMVENDKIDEDDNLEASDDTIYVDRSIRQMRPLSKDRYMDEREMAERSHDANDGRNMAQNNSTRNRDRTLEIYEEEMEGNGDVDEQFARQRVGDVSSRRSRRPTKSTHSIDQRSMRNISRSSKYVSDESCYNSQEGEFGGSQNSEISGKHSRLHHMKEKKKMSGVSRREKTVDETRNDDRRSTRTLRPISDDLYYDDIAQNDGNRKENDHNVFVRPNNSSISHRRPSSISSQGENNDLVRRYSDMMKGKENTSNKSKSKDGRPKETRRSLLEEYQVDNNRLSYVRQNGDSSHAFQPEAYDETDDEQNGTYVVGSQPMNITANQKSNRKHSEASKRKNKSRTASNTHSKSPEVNYEEINEHEFVTNSDDCDDRLVTEQLAKQNEQRRNSGRTTQQTQVNAADNVSDDDQSQSDLIESNGRNDDIAKRKDNNIVVENVNNSKNKSLGNKSSQSSAYVGNKNLKNRNVDSKRSHNPVTTPSDEGKKRNLKDRGINIAGDVVGSISLLENERRRKFVSPSKVVHTRKRLTYGGLEILEETEDTLDSEDLTVQPDNFETSSKVIPHKVIPDEPVAQQRKTGKPARRDRSARGRLAFLLDEASDGDDDSATDDTFVPEEPESRNTTARPSPARKVLGEGDGDHARTKQRDIRHKTGHVSPQEEYIENEINDPTISDQESDRSTEKETRVSGQHPTYGGMDEPDQQSYEIHDDHNPPCDDDDESEDENVSDRHRSHHRVSGQHRGRSDGHDSEGEDISEHRKNQLMASGQHHGRIRRHREESEDKEISDHQKSHQRVTGQHHGHESEEDDISDHQKSHHRVTGQHHGRSTGHESEEDDISDHRKSDHMASGKHHGRMRGEDRDDSREEDNFDNGRVSHDIDVSNESSLDKQAPNSRRRNVDVEVSNDSPLDDVQSTTTRHRIVNDDEVSNDSPSNIQSSNTHRRNIYDDGSDDSSLDIRPHHRSMVVSESDEESEPRKGASKENVKLKSRGKDASRKKKVRISEVMRTPATLQSLREGDTPIVHIYETTDDPQDSCYPQDSGTPHMPQLIVPVNPTPGMRRSRRTRVPRLKPYEFIKYKAVQDVNGTWSNEIVGVKSVTLAGDTPPQILKRDRTRVRPKKVAKPPEKQHKSHDHQKKRARNDDQFRPDDDNSDDEQNMDQDCSDDNIDKNMDDNMDGDHDHHDHKRQGHEHQNHKRQGHEHQHHERQGHEHQGQRGLMTKRSPLESISCLDTDQQSILYVDCARHYEGYEYYGSSGNINEFEDEDPYIISRIFDEHDVDSGELLLRSYGEKSNSSTHTHCIRFVVISGHVEATIHETTNKFQSRDTFYVLPGNMYSIKNLDMDPAILHYVGYRVGMNPDSSSMNDT